MDPQGHGDGNPVDPADNPLEVYYDPAEDYLLDDPDENLLAPMQYNPSHVDSLITDKKWGELEHYLISFIPTDKPFLTHPQVFHICWRRQLTDLMDQQQFAAAAALFFRNIVLLKQTSSPFADRDQLLDEIAQIEQHVGSRSRLEHRHRVDGVLQTEVNDYMRLYLPRTVGYEPRKTKLFSALWEFCIRLDIQIPGKKSHPKIRCLVCSNKTFSSANVTPMMTDHLLNHCNGPSTSNLKHRLEAAIQEETGRAKGNAVIRRLKDDRNKRGLETQSNEGSYKRQKLDKGLSSNAAQSDARELFFEQLEQGKKLIAQLRNRQELPQSNTITSDINSIETIFNNLSATFTSALGQQQATEHQMPAAGPQGDVPINAFQSAAPVAEQTEAEEVQHVEHEAEAQEPQVGVGVHNDYYYVFEDIALPDLPQLSDD